MAILDLILGRRLSSEEDKEERVGSFAGISVFGLDALSSAGYGPEAALTILIPLGVAGLKFSLPITIAVSAILTIVYFSYRQTIAAYPGGAGTYTVAKENLGRHAGLLGAVALMIDYTLNVAVGIAAGIGALISAVPALQPHTLLLCLFVLGLLAFMNLRGLREAGLAFMPPTYLFIGGRRLVYTQGICVLAVLAAILLIAFNGVTDKLIPLFAVGAFLAFTLSQAGMVLHWLRSNDSGARVSAFINGLGAVATGITLLIVIVTKFAEGAWLIIIVIPILYFFMFSVHRHYTRIAREVAISGTINLRPPREIIAIVPVENLNALAEKALQIAYGVTDRVHVLHVKDETKDRDFASEWREYVQASLDAAKLPSATLVVIESPFRRVIAPILDYIWELERRSPHFTIAVLVPQLIEAKWYYTFMHNQRATILKTRLLLEGQNRTLIVNIPWNLEKRRK